VKESVKEPVKEHVKESVKVIKTSYGKKFIKNNIKNDRVNNHSRNMSQQFRTNTNESYDDNSSDDGTTKLNNMGKSVLDEIRSDIVPECKDIKFETLDIEQLSASLGVVAGLKKGDKLNIIENKYLKIDDSYVRWTDGKTRELLINFLTHLYNECVRNIAEVLSDIENNEKVDDNIYTLKTYMPKLILFLNNFDHVNDGYSRDSTTYNRLNGVKDNFKRHYDSIFRVLGHSLANNKY
jgi:hypothetical protein